MKKIFYTFMLTAVLSAVSTADAASGGKFGKITGLLWYNGHTGVLIRQEGMADVGGCGRADYYILDDGNPYFKEIYALILSAHIAAQPIGLHLDGCVQGVSRIIHVSSNK
jgi:hypothetical protein